MAGTTFSDGAVTQSVSYRCLLAAQTVIRSLGLANIDSANVGVRKLPLRSRSPRDWRFSFRGSARPEHRNHGPRLPGVGLDDVVYGVRCAWSTSTTRNRRWSRTSTKMSPGASRSPIPRSAAGGSRSDRRQRRTSHPLLPDAWKDNLYAAGLLLHSSSQPRAVGRRRPRRPSELRGRKGQSPSFSPPTAFAQE